MDQSLVCRKMKWQDMIEEIGTETSVEDVVPGLVAALLFYLLTFIVSYTFFWISKIVVPTSLQSTSTEFIKTMLICAYPYGHAQIRESYGLVGYFLTVVPLAFFTIAAFPDGDGSPLTTFLGFLKGRVSMLVLVIRCFVQTIGAFTSYRLALFVWSLRIHSFHTHQFNSTACSSDLRVSLLVGIGIEVFCVAFDTWLSFQKLSNSPAVDSVIKICNTVLMVCLGIDLTGMYLHPAMASGLSYFCEGTSALDHILVYWISSFIGCYLGNLIHIKVTNSKLKVVHPNGTFQKGEVHDTATDTNANGISKKID